jgi:hypothetical protein
MGNFWVNKMDGPVWELRKKEYGEVAEIAAMMFERVVYLTAGRIELKYWKNISSSHANDYREWIIGHIRRTIPRYFITDQFWRTVNTKYPHLSKSADKGYHFGHIRGNMSVGTELKYLDEFFQTE